MPTEGTRYYVLTSSSDSTTMNECFLRKGVEGPHVTCSRVDDQRLRRSRARSPLGQQDFDPCELRSVTKGRSCAFESVLPFFLRFCAIGTPLICGRYRHAVI